MHDTILHTEPEEFVFVRRSRPLTEYDFKAHFLNEDPNMRFRFFDPTDNQSPRVREMLEEHEREQKGKIFVKSSDSRSNDGYFPKEPWIYRDEYGQMIEPSKSTDQ